jgi:hypothetical protein
MSTSESIRIKVYLILADLKENARGWYLFPVDRSAMCNGMARRDLHKMEQRPSGYSYGECEAALCMALGIEPGHRRLLRARLKNLQRLGLPKVTPGKGTRIRYSRAQLDVWLLAMLMSEAGMDPTIVVQAIKAEWKQLAPEIATATDKKLFDTYGPLWVVLWPRLAGSAWADGRPSLSVQVLRDPPRSNDLARIVETAGERDRCICLFNFTRPANRLQSNLLWRP